MDGHVAYKGHEKCIPSLGQKPKGKKRPLGRPWHRGENNIKMDLGKIEWEVLDWNIWLRIEACGGLL
jgi:hypothetical protein